MRKDLTIKLIIKIAFYKNVVFINISKLTAATCGIFIG
ncbi:hypothetical protein HJ01_03083 [Flavobacterium frigoris PS1]|uniref:Uncharacterized protein n=1 Tax=Flavobacterium frigoris (strain PS1) TaxID=1086011 RepID=H7FV85_FLAFP|nr:hypothetical protein HJ01_03083 [Flavobacterium frigoris PS1]